MSENLNNNEFFNKVQQERPQPQPISDTPITDSATRKQCGFAVSPQVAKSLERDRANFAHKVDALQTENWKLKSLLMHAYVHDNYADCGFAQMTTEQKKLFVKILEEDQPADVARLKEFIAE